MSVQFLCDVENVRCITPLKTSVLLYHRDYRKRHMLLMLDIFCCPIIVLHLAT